MNAAQSLNSFLASSVLRDVVKNDASCGDYVLFSDYMVRAAFLFEMGAVLGYWFRDRIPVFTFLIAARGTEERVISLLMEHAADRLAKLGHKPSAFELVYFAPEATRIIGILRDAGVTGATDWLEVHKVAGQKMRVADIFGSLQMATAEGGGFGCRFPDLTCELLSSETDSAAYGELLAAGLSVPATASKRKTMRERWDTARSMIRPFVQQVRPDLAAELEL